jgi:hypothetical protein
MARRRARLALERIGDRIVLLRGEKVLLDTDLAGLYGVTTGRLNEQVKRNRRRFPRDFVFALTNQEVTNLKSQFAISSSDRRQWGGRRSQPTAFTEHGALMAANVLNSRQAAQVSIYVVRAFVRLRRTLATNRELAQKLEQLEHKVEQLATRHDALTAETREQFKQVVEALRRLMTPPEPARRPIGFVTPK